MVQAIALIDGNNFYAACEQSIDPSVAKRPLVILSNNDGCIIARSPEARELGIPMGQPYFRIRNKLERLGVIVRSSNYALYGDMSQRLMNLLDENCEGIEIYSIDEAFARINRPSNGDLHPWARRLRALSNQSLGLPISIGFGASKGQAKLANHLAKTRAFHAGIFDLINIQDQDSYLESIPIENVWGIGQKSAHWCRLKGINTAKQLRDIPSNQLKAQLGIVGIRLQQELLGQACLPLATTPSPKQTTCVSRSFGHSVTSLEELIEAIATYVVHASEKLRRQRQLTQSISVFIRTNPFAPSFYSQEATTRLGVPTNDTTVLLPTALALTRKIFSAHKQFTKAGVIMRHLQSADYQQQSLLATYSQEGQYRRDQLMRTIDQINASYGKGTISWACCGLKQHWNMRREKISCAATTRIMEIPIVKA